MTTYRIIYERKGYEVSAFQTLYGIPDRALAEKLLGKLQKRPIFRDVKLYIKEDTADLQISPCRSYKGKVVANYDYFIPQAADIGEYVEQEVVDGYINAMTPAAMGHSCSQLGEPYSLRIDPDTGAERNTYLTFKYVGDNVWEFCGDCFRGEAVVRGEIPAYMKGGVA